MVPSRLESATSPGLPLQVICYERADGLGFGVSGAVTRARGIRSSFPGVDLTQIPMAAAGQEGETGLPAGSVAGQPSFFRIQGGRPHASLARIRFRLKHEALRVAVFARVHEEA